MRLFAATFALCLACATPALARDIYVSNVRGDDHFNGCSETIAGGGAGPVRTIARALRIVEKGDRIVLAKTEVPYRESISLSTGRHSGYEHMPLVIYGNGAILDGTLPVPPVAWQHVEGDLFRFRPRRLTYQQLYLGGKPAVRRRVEPSVPELPQLAPLEWMLLDGHIYFRCESGRLPEDYELRFAGRQTGITLYHVRNVVIRDLVVQGFQLDGVNAHDGVNRAVLAGLTCRGNGRSGISVGGSSRVLVQNCLIGDNGEAQFRIEGFSLAELEATDLIANTAPALEVEGGQLLIDGVRYAPEH